MGDNREYIGHYHTGGVPGRNELDDDQELQWQAIARRDRRQGLHRLLRARIHSRSAIR